MTSIDNGIDGGDSRARTMNNSPQDIRFRQANLQHIFATGNRLILGIRKGNGESLKCLPAFSLFAGHSATLSLPSAQQGSAGCISRAVGTRRIEARRKVGNDVRRRGMNCYRPLTTAMSAAYWKLAEKKPG